MKGKEKNSRQDRPRSISNGAICSDWIHIVAGFVEDYVYCSRMNVEKGNIV